MNINKSNFRSKEDKFNAGQGQEVSTFFLFSEKNKNDACKGHFT